MHSHPSLVNSRDPWVLLCCPTDGSSLAQNGENYVTCSDEGHDFAIRDGILSLIHKQVGDAMLAGEQALWDQGATEYDSRVTTGRRILNEMEIPPTLAALGNLTGKTVLELGCGTGRFSVLLAPKCHELVAVDFSAKELAIVRGKLREDRRVALVQADVTQPIGGPRAFDVIISSQVVQALPTRDHRMSMFRCAADGLTDSGRFVFTTYHHGLRNHLFGIAKAARYTHGGIFRYYSTIEEITREIRPYFHDVRVRPIQVVVPGAERIGLSPVLLSRVAERIPGIRQLGILLLVEASRPVRPPEEGEPSMAVEDFVTLLRRRSASARERRKQAG